MPMQNRYEIDLHNRLVTIYNRRDDHPIVFDLEDFPTISLYTWYINDKGYAVTNYWYTPDKRSTCLAHRLIIQTGQYEVDHINGNRTDNRKVNLRLANRTMQTENNRKAKGYTKFRGKYKAQIGTKVNGVSKTINLGLYNTPDEARAAYLTAKQQYHPSTPPDYFTCVR